MLMPLVHAHQVDDGGRATTQPFKAAPPPLEFGIALSRWRERRNAVASSPGRLHVIEKAVELLLGRKPIGKFRKAAVEDQGGASLGMGCSKQRPERSAFGHAHDGSPFDARCIHHRPGVVHPLVQIGQLAETVGQASASLVKHDNPRPRRQMIEPGCLIRGIPHVFDVRNEARDDDEVLRPVAEHLIGNVDVATFGVTNFRVH